MILHEAQKQIAVDTHRFRVVNCGRQFGKTTLAILEMVAKAVFKKNQRIAYIAPNYQQARDIAWQELKKVAQPITVTTNESRLEIIIKTTDGGTSTIVLRGWESVETLRGQQFDFLVIDEVAMMRKFWVNWEEVLLPTLTARKGDVLFISTPNGFNHFYELYNLQDKDFKSFHFTSYDNPFLPKDELESHKQRMSEDSFAQEYMADFRKREGLVFKEFRRELHLTEKEPDHTIDFIAGIDFGFTNPSAVVFIKKDHDGRFWVTDEWYKTGRTETEVADYVYSCQFNAVYPDPENPSAIEVLKRKGIPVKEVRKGKDSVITGINFIKDQFRQNRLFIHPRCINLVSELETYHYEEGKETPEKEKDHAIDALRYALHNSRTDIQDPFFAQRMFIERERNLRPNSI
jgi:PBSX family phage terminase large subunit